MASEKPKKERPTVALDLLSADLELDFSEQDCAVARMAGPPCVGYLFSGARANTGVLEGKFYFTATIGQLLPVEVPTVEGAQAKGMRTGFQARIGVSLASAPVNQLGECQDSWAFSSSGRCLDSTRGPYSYSEPFGPGDAITVFLDLSQDPCTLSFAKNGTLLGMAFRVPQPTNPTEAYYPHILLKNVSVRVDFKGVLQLGRALPFSLDFNGYQPWQCAWNHQNAAVGAQEKRRSSTTLCQVAMMIGLPGAGKTTHALDYMSTKAHRRYVLLGTAPLLEQMRIVLSTGRNPLYSEDEKVEKLYSDPDERLMDGVADLLEALIRRAPSRARNYIIDQTNVIAENRALKLAPFRAAGFCCRAFVVVVNDSTLFTRQHFQFKQERKQVPDLAMAFLKANFKLPEVGDGCEFEGGHYFEEQPEPAVKIIEAQRQAGNAWLSWHAKHLEATGKESVTLPAPPSAVCDSSNTATATNAATATTLKIEDAAQPPAAPAAAVAATAAAAAALAAAAAAGAGGNVPDGGLLSGVGGGGAGGGGAGAVAGGIADPSLPAPAQISGYHSTAHGTTWHGKSEDTDTWHGKSEDAGTLQQYEPMDVDGQADALVDADAGAAKPQWAWIPAEGIPADGLWRWWDGERYTGESRTHEEHYALPEQLQGQHDPQQAQHDPQLQGPHDPQLQDPQPQDSQLQAPPAFTLQPLEAGDGGLPQTNEQLLASLPHAEYPPLMPGSLNSPEGSPQPPLPDQAGGLMGARAPSPPPWADQAGALMGARPPTPLPDDAKTLEMRLLRLAKLKEKYAGRQAPAPGHQQFPAGGPVPHVVQADGAGPNVMPHHFPPPVPPPVPPPPLPDVWQQQSFLAQPTQQPQTMFVQPQHHQQQQLQYEQQRQQQQQQQQQYEQQRELQQRQEYEQQQRQLQQQQLQQRQEYEQQQQRQLQQQQPYQQQQHYQQYG